MSQRKLVSLLALTAQLLLLPGTTALAQREDEKDDKKKGKQKLAYVSLRLEVTAGSKDEPVDNASVIVRFPEDGRSIRKKLTTYELKTNQQGVTRVPEVPRGKILIQVVASGWKTFGKWYDLEKESGTIKIKLQDPPRWY